MASNFSSRRRHLLVGGASLITLPMMSRAQRPETVRVVVGYPPGGAVDLIARKLAQKLIGVVAANIVVENKPGAAGRVGIEDVKRAAPGSSILVTPSSTMTMYPYVYRQLAYDPLTDFAPVSTVAATAFALVVGPQVPADVRNLPNLVRWSKSQGEPVPCGNAGAGSMPHFMSLTMGSALGIAIIPVPYRGGLAAVQGVAGGEIPMALAVEGTARPLTQAGKVRVLATTWERRSPFLADAPTFHEAGVPGMVQREWFGVFMPARTPPTQVRALADALGSMVTEPDVVEMWERASLGVDVSGPLGLAAEMQVESDRWERIVKESGFTPESS